MEIESDAKRLIVVQGEKVKRKCSQSCRSKRLKLGVLVRGKEGSGGGTCWDAQSGSLKRCWLWGK